ncbi:MAG: D-alanyl-D-alanine carboxypeptidase/D-alanyl-D-alanine-endopeptidase [Rhodoglobus sp.]
MTDSQDPSGAPTRRSMRDSGKSSRARTRSSSEARASSAGADIHRGTPSGGIRALVAKHPLAWPLSAAAVVFLLLGTASVFAGLSAGSNSSAAALPHSASAYPLRPQPSAIPTSSHLRTCSVAAIAADPRLANFSGYVARADTGETLFDRNGEQPQRTGSVLKTLTAAAALSVLGPAAQLSTKVIDGSLPGTIVLQGGGDPTLANTTNTFYDGAPQIGDLATQAMSNYKAKHPGVPITTIVLDATMWDPADNWDPSWDRGEQSAGFQAPVTALMINGGREDPSQLVSTRTNDPVGDAGRAFASAAGLNGVAFTTGAAIGSTVLAEVKSQPLSTLISEMLLNSDNMLAEMLARDTSKALGFNGGSASLAQAIPGALVAYGLPTTTITIRDGSGLSDLNAVSPQFVSLLMAKVAASTNDLGVVLAGLPVAGQSGTLSGRFEGPNAIAAGNVLAKTGMLETEYALGGIIRAADGTQLVFAFYSIRDGITSDAKDAQDALATGVFSCGNNLSNN